MKTIKELKCKRCGHKWFPRSTQLPLVCPNPKCNSPYWSRKRTKGVLKDEVAKL